jgi:hypothetical protein
MPKGIGEEVRDVVNRAERPVMEMPDVGMPIVGMPVGVQIEAQPRGAAKAVGLVLDDQKADGQTVDDQKADGQTVDGQKADGQKVDDLRVGDLKLKVFVLADFDLVDQETLVHAEVVQGLVIANRECRPQC